MALSDGDLEYKLLTRDMVDVALRLQIRTMRQENLAIGVGMFDEPGAPEEMSLVFREVIKDGATMIAVDRNTGQLAAVAFNAIHVPSDLEVTEACESVLDRPVQLPCVLKVRPRKGEGNQQQAPAEKSLGRRACRELIKFLDNIEGAVDVYEMCNADSAMELFYLATDPRWQGRGIGRRMVQKCIEFCRGLADGTATTVTIDGVALDRHAPPRFIYGVFASNYSQRIADRLGFVCVNEIQYEDYASGGARMSERIGAAHKSAKLQVLKL